ncbi:MAG: thiamine-phosphate kinase [Gammaproteobacteria bacterium RIFCSPLOWO2_02_FULL_61_13]|nr:MAG: thiamine-phosphate kinase [Gammaproteobacteria bacterium RIFCSPLOWO2_02_FULL_61_13]
MPGDEYALIRRYFQNLTATRADVRRGIGDDAAVLAVPAGHELVVSTDTLINDVHFPAATLPADIGFKSMAVNLSDMAAMGAEPRWATLALTLPAAEPGFLEPFCAGFAESAQAHNVALVGGDLTRGPLSVTVQIMGTVPAGSALLRSGARPGDQIWVTGELGSAALGLAVLQGRHAGNAPGLDACVRRLNRPAPCVQVGLLLRGVATAAIDISDGLLTDLGHVLRASGVGARVELSSIPMGVALSALPDASARWQYALGGGDDYELCYTVASGEAAGLASRLKASGCHASHIGSVTAGDAIAWIGADGVAVDFGARTGYQHF